MLGRLTRAARGVGPLRRRGYSTGLMDDDVVAALSSDSTLASRIQSIVHPSTYDQIARTKHIAQTARLSHQDTGQQLFADAARQRATLGTRLWHLYKEQRRDALAAEDFAALLSGFSGLKDGVGCASVLRDMRGAGVEVGEAQVRAALDASTTPGAVFAVADGVGRWPGAGLERLYHSRLVAALARAGQAEYAWAVALDMQQRGLAPDDTCVRPLVAALADAGEPQASMQAAHWGGQHGITLPAPVLLRMLHALGRYSADCAGYADVWQKLVACAGPAEQPVEEDCLAGLRLAARSGDHVLAHRVVGHLRARGFALRAVYVEALVAALARAGEWERAFAALGEARAEGACTTAGAVRSVARVLADAGGQAVAAGDRAYAALQQASGLAADTVTLDALVGGIAQAGHPSEALDRLSPWYDALAQPRTLSSYLGILRCCIYPSNQRVAERLMQAMLDVDGLQPSADVYELMVRVSLGQFNYEDAFVYLDAVKAQGAAPQWATYAAVARRCAVAGDPRAAVALGEMRRMGLPVTDALQAYVDARGRSPRHDARSRRRKTPQPPQPPSDGIDFEL